MAVSVDRATRNLQQGVVEVQRAFAAGSPTGAAYDRVGRLVEASVNITWVAGAARRGGPDLQVVVLDGEPPAHLNADATFQANRDADGGVRVYVQRRSYTPLWAAVSLFHELDHVLDYLEGVWPNPESISESDWWAGEARAYHREALLIDLAVAGGRLVPALDTLAARGLDLLLDGDPEDIGSTVYSEVVPARLRRGQEFHERGARNTALAFAAVLAATVTPESLNHVADLSSSGQELRRAAVQWGYLNA